MTEMTMNAPEVMCEPTPETLPEIPAAVPEAEAAAEVTTEMPEPEKPYKFRKLGAPDVFLMFKIISDIGINEFTVVFGADGVINTLKQIKEKEDQTDQDSAEMMAAASVAMEIVPIILGNIGKCEKKIYELLAKTSNLTVEEITADGNAVMFMEMVIDFLKKDEFPDFFKVVSKLFK